MHSLELSNVQREKGHIIYSISFALELHLILEVFITYVLFVFLCYSIYQYFDTSICNCTSEASIYIVQNICPSFFFFLLKVYICPEVNTTALLSQCSFIWDPCGRGYSWVLKTADAKGWKIRRPSCRCAMVQ